MIVSGLLILMVSLIFLPAFNYYAQNGNFTTSASATTFFINGVPHTFNGTFPFKSGAIPGFVSGIIGAVGSFGLASGIIVLLSGILLRTSTSNRTTWGVLIIVFSVVSFFGTGGFIIGAILGIIGGIMALTWKPSTSVA
jgi:Family of unknown function (DUF6114)